VAGVRITALPGRRGGFLPAWDCHVVTPDGLLRPQTCYTANAFGGLTLSRSDTVASLIRSTCLPTPTTTRTLQHFFCALWDCGGARLHDTYHELSSASHTIFLHFRLHAHGALTHNMTRFHHTWVCIFTFANTHICWSCAATLGCPTSATCHLYLLFLVMLTFSPMLPGMFHDAPLTTTPQPYAYLPACDIIHGLPEPRYRARIWPTPVLWWPYSCRRRNLVWSLPPTLHCCAGAGRRLPTIPPATLLTTYSPMSLLPMDGSPYGCSAAGLAQDEHALFVRDSPTRYLKITVY